MNDLRSNDLTDHILQQDEHLVHAFSDLHSLQQEGARTVISQAEGAYVYNARGDRFLDGMAGLWCVNIGHGRPEIAAAVAEQLNTLDYYSTFYNLTHPTAATLAHKIAELAPGELNHVYFANSGSVANDSAVRVLHHYNNRLGNPNKKKILSRVGAYHGSTHLAIAMTTPKYRAGWDSADELVHFLSSPCRYHHPDTISDDEFCDFLVEEMRDAIESLGADNIACFIAEPLMGAGGVIVPPPGYHTRTAELCKNHNIKLISDEVVTAFGRLGHMFASSDVFGLQPDVISTAKGLSSGYQPISATIFSDEIFDVIATKDNNFLHGMTYSGHPACCAAALTNIAIIENENLCEYVRSIGPSFEQAIQSLEDLPVVGDVRGSSFMMGVEFVKDKANRTPFADAVNFGEKVSRQAQLRGLLVRSLGHMIVLSPPLILDESQINDVASILRKSIIAATAEVA